MIATTRAIGRSRDVTGSDPFRHTKVNNARVCATIGYAGVETLSSNNMG